jgi:hypothetical protein
MTLSWGHRPPELEPPSTSRRPRWHYAFVAIGLVVVGAVAFYPRPLGAAERQRAAIAALLEAQHNAIAARDVNAYLATLDPSRVPLRTCEQQRFETAALLKYPVPDLRLGRTEPYKDYVRAMVGDISGWRRIFLRNEGDHWYVTEPTTGDLGGEVTREFAGIKVTANEAEADLIDPIGHDLDPVRAAVEQYAPTPPTKLFTVRVATLTASVGRCFVAGTAQLGYDNTSLTMRDVTLANGYASLSRTSLGVLTHEAFHWIQLDRSADAMRAIDWWLGEGWPERNAADPSGPRREDAICSAPLPSYDDMRRAPFPLTPAIEVGRRYTIAAVLIDRLAGQYGADAYWRLFDAFGTEFNADRAYQVALGTDGPTFYGSWAAEARAHYC